MYSTWILLASLSTLCGVFASNAKPFNDELDIVAIETGLDPGKESKCLQDRGYNMGSVCRQPTMVGFMATVERYLRGQKTLVDRSVPCGDERRDSNTEVDFVVVGSGVGSVVARRLAEQNYRVLLLEAGGPAPVGTQIPGTYFQYIDHPDFDWNFKLEKEENACLSQGGVCSWPRGRMMGGTTQLHGMMYMRGYPQDFNNLNISGWTWDDVMPYYLKSEDNLNIGTNAADAEYHATGGILTVARFNDHPALAEDILKAASNLGYKTDHDMNGKHRTGFTFAQATTRNGERLSTSRAYIYDIDNPTQNGRLRVRTNAFVTKIVFNERNEAVGVEYEKDSNTYFVKTRKEVIISAGSVQSPQLLMVSGVGPKANLEEVGVPVVHDLPGVGENLKNHGSISIDFTVNGDKGYTTMNEKSLKEFLKKRKGPFTSTGLSQLTGFLHSKLSNEKTDAPDVQIFFAGYLANCASTGKTNELVNPKSQKRTMSITPTLLRPKSVGYLRLKSNNAKVPPRIFANLLKDKEDIEVILEGVRIAKKLSQSAPLDKLITLDPTPVKGCESLEFNSDDYWRCVIVHKTNPENHQVGTCKMGNDDDPMAVTDNRLRVRGVKNLRVIDSSIFPNVPSGNLVAPAIMAAEKGADMIIEDHSQGPQQKSNWNYLDSKLL